MGGQDVQVLEWGGVHGFAVKLGCLQRALGSQGRAVSRGRQVGLWV